MATSMGGLPEKVETPWLDVFAGMYRNYLWWTAHLSIQTIRLWCGVSVSSVVGSLITGIVFIFLFSGFFGVVRWLRSEWQRSKVQAEEMIRIRVETAGEEDPFADWDQRLLEQNYVHVPSALQHMKDEEKRGSRS